MREIGMAMLNQQTSKVMSRVAAGEITRVTDHGVLKGIIIPPPTSKYEEYVLLGLIVPPAHPDDDLSDLRPVPSDRTPVQLVARDDRL